jgi:hypothetical protein
MSMGFMDNMARVLAAALNLAVVIGVLLAIAGVSLGV